MKQSFPQSTSQVIRRLAFVSRIGIAALFLFAAGAKALSISSFVINVSELVGGRLAWSVSLAVVAVEFAVVVLLAIPRTTRWGGMLAATLLIGFAGYALHYVYVLGGEPLECGCFGGLIASQLGVSTALRNLALLIPVGLVIFSPPPRKLHSPGHV